MSTVISDPERLSAQADLPLRLGILDHYTLIVPDAAAASRFHTEVLGFELLRIQRVNAGSVPEGEYDMLNYVLQLPGAPGRVLVVTEGLTADSIFQQYLVKYGPGVHHIAYEVHDIDAACETLRAAGYRLTSDRVLRDPLTGLRQVFIASEHGGYFIELLERTPVAAGGAFTEHNMAALAQTMTGYLDGSTPVAADKPDEPRVRIASGRDPVLAFLAEPFNLPRWTGHRGVRRVNGALVEVRMHGDVPLAVTADDGGVAFRWTLDDQMLEVRFDVSGDASTTEVSVQLPPLDPDRLARTRRIIAAELRLLRAILEERAADEADRTLIDTFHLDVHQRRGL